MSDYAEIPTADLRAAVQRGDAALRRALKITAVPSRELEDLRTVCAQRRLVLRKREAAEAMEVARADSHDS